MINFTCFTIKINEFWVHSDISKITTQPCANEMIEEEYEENPNVKVQ